jgi:multiple sugar transport system permease protein
MATEHADVSETTDDWYSRGLLWVEDHLKWVLVFPALVFLAALMVYPVARAFQLSFFRMLETGTEFVLLGNYVEILTNSTYQNALWVTAKFVVLATGLEMLFGVAMAFLLDRNLRFRGGIQTLILVPIVISPTVVALLWQLLYTSGGLLDYLVAPLAGQPLPWLSDPSLALWSLVVADVWQMTPLVVLVVLAGLQAVPNDVREAAMMDGAGALRRVLDITLPYVKDLVILILILRVVGTMRVFAKVFVLTQGGPAGSTNVISMALYRQAFRFGNFGVASAMAIVLLVIALVIAVAFAKIADVEF